MKHRSEALAACVCMVIIMAFVVGMRAGLHDVDVTAEETHRAEVTALKSEIAALQEALDYQSQIEHVVVEYEYTPLPVDYPTVPSVDESDATIIAKTLWGEYRDSTNYNQCAAVVWCVLNRVDAGYGSIQDVCTSGQFHGYNANNPVDAELYKICIDVLMRWQLESVGANSDVGRVIPADFLWFEGNGRTNTYRNAYLGGEHITP